MSGPRVLISGASIAGPALAYWLVRAGCRVTVVERAPSLRRDGQGVDVRDTAREVIKRMGVFQTMLERSSKEEGLRVVDSNNKFLASFAVDESGKGDSFTCDIEILRGEMANILYDITKNNVSYIFGDMVDSLQETSENVTVHFANGTPSETFDLVVAADGIGSKIRRLAMGSSPSHIKPLNAYVAYFSLPPHHTDSMWSRVHWVGNGRNIALRPDNMGRTRAFITLTAYTHTDPRLARVAQAARQDVAAQKAVMQDLFQDGDWETKRILDGMHDADDFYLQDCAQVHLPHWSSPASGRVTVVGDAGFAPSPFTGMGTSLAFIGAYILAGEISKQPNDIPAALDAYEKQLKPYVESIQKLPPGIPWIVNPQSRWGVKVLETIVTGFGLLAGTGVAGVLETIWKWVPFLGGDPFRLPEYEKFGKSSDEELKD